MRKANRELQSQTAKMSDIQKIDHLQKRCYDLLSEMKRHERESIKNKKRADQLQKEKDHARNELTKNTGLREKLEKLCRELQKENNKLKVSICCSIARAQDSVGARLTLVARMRTRRFPIRNGGTKRLGTRNTALYYRRWTTTKRKRTTRGSKLWIWTLKSCACVPSWRFWTVSHVLQV